MSTYSNEHKEYLKKIKKNKILVLFFQVFIVISFIIIWEVISRLDLINSFLTSSPTKVFNTLISLIKAHNLFNHIYITTKEVLISFGLASILGFIIASLFWFNKTIAKIFDPYLTV